jgi:hypothetical protein
VVETLSGAKRKDMVPSAAADQAEST